MQKIINACLCAVTLSSSHYCLAESSAARSFPEGSNEVFITDAADINTQPLKEIDR